MKILVFSDSHGNTSLIKKAVKANEDAQVILHAGDYARDINFLCDKQRHIYAVKGNCDYYDSFEEEMIINEDGVKILLSHGNNYHVKGNVESYAKKANELGADIAVFGHTHEAFRANVFGSFLLNPGSINPYNARRFPSYAIILTDNGDITKVEIINVV